MTTGKTLGIEKIPEKYGTKLQRIANSVARKHGYNKATDIVFDNSTDEPYIYNRVAYGYRKKTTDQYVPNAYLSNFGWKNTYYQSAETVVALPERFRCFLIVKHILPLE